MKNLVIPAALAAAIVASIVGMASSAQAAEGWYISGNAGASIFKETDASDTAAGVTVKGTAEGDIGIFASGAVGYS
jgi:hypothetical protein